MKNIFTLLFILISTNFICANLFAAKKSDNTTKVISLTKYMVQHKSALLKNNLDFKIIAKHSPGETLLNEKKITCIANNKCSVPKKAITSLVFTSSKIDANLKTLVNNLSTFYKMQMTVQKPEVKSGFSLIYFAFIATGSLMLFLLFKIFSTPKQKLNATVVKNVQSFEEQQIKYLTEENKKLEQDLEGVYFLWESAKINYSAVQNKFEMTNKLPKHISKRLFEYEAKENSKKIKRPSRVSIDSEA